jgi:hypothetical protein
LRFATTIMNWRAVVGSLVFAVATLLSATGAWASGPAVVGAPVAEEEPIRQQSTAFFGVLGGPVGIGVEVVRRFGRFFELSGGAGVSPARFNDADGAINSPFTWSVMPRLRLVRSKWDLTLGGGLSGGPETQDSSCGFADDECTVTLQRAGYLTKLNGEIGAERWSESGFAFRIFAGYGHVLDPQGFRCVASMPSCPQGSASGLYAGFGLGYAF